MTHEGDIVEEPSTQPPKKHRAAWLEFQTDDGVWHPLAPWTDTSGHTSPEHPDPTSN